MTNLLAARNNRPAPFTVGPGDQRRHAGDPDNVTVPLLDRARRATEIVFAEAGPADAAARLSKRALMAMCDAGLLLAVFPTRHGGEDLLAPERSRDLSALLRLIGGADLSLGRLFEGHVNAAGLVARYGNEAQLAELAAYARGGGFSGVWNAEGGEPLTAISTHGGWLLKGQKILASGAGSITRPIVTAATPEGSVMLLPGLNGGTPVDLSRWTPLGMRATATGTVDFSGLEVPLASQIGSLGDYMRQPVFSGGAWRFCAVHLGAAERLVDLFRAHLVARRRADDSFQKQRIAGCVAAVVSARHWIERAAALLDETSSDAGEAVAYVNLTRMVTERACLDVLEAVQRGMGLGAFMRPDPVERIARDLSTYLRQPVPDAAMTDAAGMVLGSTTSTFDLWSSPA